MVDARSYMDSSGSFSETLIDIDFFRIYSISAAAVMMVPPRPSKTTF
jgi:hypothetical protein